MRSVVNSLLREWGNKQYERAEEAERKLSEQLDINCALQDRIEVLEEEISVLENKIKDIEFGVL